MRHYNAWHGDCYNKCRSLNLMNKGEYMKKFLTVMMISTFTFAGTTATLNLRGTVGQVVDISLVAESDAQSLDLSSTTSDKKVATVTEQSNSNVGYSVTVSSDNSGKLVHSNGDTFDYVLKYGGVDAELSSGGKTFSRSTSGLVSDNFDATVSYTGKSAATMVSGQYDDVVTFTISAN